MKNNNKNQEEVTDKSNKKLGKFKPGNKTPKEFGGPNGLEPTRYGDWERRGRCIDF